MYLDVTHAFLSTVHGKKRGILSSSGTVWRKYLDGGRRNRYTAVWDIGIMYKNDL